MSGQEISGQGDSLRVNKSTNWPALASLSIASWVGSIFGIAGALILALNLPASGFGYLFFLVSSAAWTYSSVKMKSTSLFMMQSVFTVINVIGVVRWLF